MKAINRRSAYMTGLGSLLEEEERMREGPAR